MTAIRSLIGSSTRLASTDSSRIVRGKRKMRANGHRIGGFVQGILDAIVEAKIRRLQRELLFHGAHYRTKPNFNGR
jgi:hypothetical protein